MSSQAVPGILAPHLAAALSYRPPAPGTPAITPADIRGVHLQRHHPRHAEAVAVVRNSQRTWDALLIALHRAPQRGWRVTELTTLQERIARRRGQ